MYPVKSCPSGALRPLKIVNKSLVVLCRCFLPMDLCLLLWLIYKVLHLSPYSNLVLWGAICYTIFSHWSSHLDIEPTSSLVTLTPCLPVTLLHFPEYLIDLCLAIRQVLPLWSNLEMLKNWIFPHCHTLLTNNMRQYRTLLTDNLRQSRFAQFLRDLSRSF